MDYDFQWRCPDCFPASRTYVRTEVKCTIPTVESHFVSGTIIICVNCKRYYVKYEQVKAMVRGEEVLVTILENATNKKDPSGEFYPYAKASYGNDNIFFIMRSDGAWREITEEQIRAREEVRKQMRRDKAALDRQNR